MITSRSTASPSRLSSSEVPCTLMRSTVTGFALGTTSGTMVCTWAFSRPAGAAMMAHAAAMDNATAFILTSSFGGLLHRVGINVHAERAHGDGVGQDSDRLVFDLDLRFLIDLNGCVNFVRSHPIEMALTCELRSTDGELDVLFGVGGVEHGYGQGLIVFTQRGAYIQRIGVAAGIHRRLVAAGGEHWF